ncbi:MAG: InlB B-repeat-containing protein, partial [Acholeplasmatales bacterium]|nr:InlB B-repeat-containing protein [Acholeplasmatales bacterium]
MKKLKFIGLIAGAIALVGLASCGNNGGEEPPAVTPEKVQYTISFKYDDGTLFDSLIVDENTVPTLPQAPEKEGYSFDDWYLDAALTTKYEAKAITSNITLYPKYYIQYSVKLVLDKDDMDNEGYEVLYTDITGKLTKPEDPVRIGYTFINWYSDPYYRGIANFDAQVTKNTNYFAKWELNTYNITFDSDGGSNINTVEYTVEDLDISLPIPNKTGFIFSHWEDSEGNQYNIIDTLTAKNYQLKAVYRDATKIDIVCDTLASSHDISSYAALKDNIFTLNVEIRSRIATWTNHTNSNEKITFNQSYKMANDSRNIAF